MGIILLIALRLQDADVRQVAVVVGVVEAVADDKFVGDLEAAHVGLVALRVPCRLVEEGDGRDGRGIARAEELAQVLHREAGVDDVFDDDDVAAGP